MSIGEAQLSISKAQQIAADAWRDFNASEDKRGSGSVKCFACRAKYGVRAPAFPPDYTGNCPICGDKMQHSTVAA